MELEKEIQESIKKNLPQQVSDVLKARLEQADKDAARVKTLEKEVKDLEEQEEVFKSTIKEYNKLDERNSLLESRGKELETKERNLEIEQLKYQLSAEKDKTTFSQSVALGLVRNIEYRKNIFDSENPGGAPTFDQYNNAHYPMSTSKHHESTERAE
jgi:DNA repair exonuclease SbcCD ATPase subunit